MDDLKLKAIIKMDLTIADEYHERLVKKKPKDPLGESTILVGTKKDIKKKISEMIDNASDVLEDWYDGE